MRFEPAKLGEMIEIKHGFAFKSRFFSDSGEYILLTPGNCYEAGGLKLKGDKEKYYTGDIPEGYLLKEGDLMVVMTDLVNSAPILGGSFIIPEDDKYLHNQRLGRIEIVEPSRIDKNFLYYLLNTYRYRAQVRGSASGATVRHTSPGRIRACDVLIPSDVGYQAQIAGVLSAYDDLIENNRQRMALLEEAARQLHREWFVRLRFPGHEHTTITDGVPKEWEKKTAHDALLVLSGGTPKTTVSDYWDGDIPFYTPKDAVDGFWVTDAERTITELGLSKCNSKLYPRETVFISARGTVGNLNMAQRSMAMSQSCYALIGKDHLTQPFVFCAMYAAVKLLRQQAVGAVFNAIIVDTFKRIKLLVPDEKFMRQFDEAARPLIEQVENLTLQNQKLRAARGLLLPRLMSGELAV